MTITHLLLMSPSSQILSYRRKANPTGLGRLWFGLNVTPLYFYAIQFDVF